jgi:hypothetical protein
MGCAVVATLSPPPPPVLTVDDDVVGLSVDGAVDDFDVDASAAPSPPSPVFDDLVERADMIG